MTGIEVGYQDLQYNRAQDRKKLCRDILLIYHSNYLGVFSKIFSFPIPEFGLLLAIRRPLFQVLQKGQCTMTDIQEILE